MSQPVQVAVGVLQRGDGRVLVARRDARRHQGGGLEFPGGKVESGESIERALARELAEELGIRPLTTTPLMTIGHRYSDRAVTLHVRLVTEWSGEPLTDTPDDCTWCAAATLDQRDFPVANRPLLAALRWPAYSPVTPSLEADETQGTGGAAAGWRRIVAAAIGADRPRLLRLRLWEHARDKASSLEWLRDAVPGHPATRVLVNAPAEQIETMPPWVGLHLTAREAACAAGRPLSPQRMLSCACHGPREIERAEALDVDLAYLGPVKPTPTHPGASPLAWDGFRALAERSDLPLYAIGGLGPVDLADARAAGASGVAGIRGFWPA